MSRIEVTQPSYQIARTALSCEGRGNNSVVIKHSEMMICTAKAEECSLQFAEPDIGNGAVKRRCADL
jgi:hypothetical protein